ncbi:hypothetical protein R3P38DRAFT_2843790 [Favolaschia claudopus]|uniref:Uncharacterized protein n=1 Tax=Favolaschia claudopus TaxID=2862362 RepID=A0AAW0DYV1_9AGAR
MPPKPKVLQTKKTLKLKAYRIPEGQHYLLLQNPWPFEDTVSTARTPQTYVNAVICWLCCMLGDLCDINMRPSDIRIFYQSTHRDLIAEISANLPEFPGQVLGAHHSSAFLVPRYAGRVDCMAVVYEYDYVRFNSPEKTNWTSYVASVATVPLDFAVKHEAMNFPYPSPSPTDARPHKFAKPLPTRLRLGHPDCPPQVPQAQEPPAAPSNVAGPSQPNALEPNARRDRTAVPLDDHPRASSSAARPSSSSPSPPPPEQHPRSEFAFTPYERPSHFPTGEIQPANTTNPQRTKRDPYEEEADAEEVLRDTVPSITLSRGVKIEGENDVGVHVKLEAGGIKEEGYDPSPELRNIFAQGQKASIERKGAERSPRDSSLHERVKMEDGVKKEEDYVPSAEWQASYRQRDQRLGSARDTPPQVRVKVEGRDMPLDVPMPDAPADRFGSRVLVKKEQESEWNSRQPSASAYPRQPEYASRSSSGVKQEYREPNYLDRGPRSDFESRHSHIKSEFEHQRNRGRSRAVPNSPLYFPRYEDMEKVHPREHAIRREGNNSNHSRNTSRTYSPPPQPVKRERDQYNDDHRSLRPSEPPVKREKVESRVPDNKSTSFIRTLDPRVRVKREGE